MNNRSRSGISEVVGAMLLIVVVVVAVGTFASYLSYAQNTNENRQNFQTQVKDEDLKIQQIQIQSHTAFSNISSINFTIMNFNTFSSELRYLSIDHHYLKFSSGSFLYNGSSPLSIPARGSTFLYVNTSSLDIFRNQSILVTLATQLGNYFQFLFESPNAIISESLINENYGNGNISDIPIFSGQYSTFNNSTSILYYEWVLTAGSSTCVISGSRLAFAYRSNLCPGFPFPRGPFNVTLLVQDTNGLISNSTLPFPYDPNIPV